MILLQHNLALPDYYGMFDWRKRVRKLKEWVSWFSGSWDDEFLKTVYFLPLENMYIPGD